MSTSPAPTKESAFLPAARPVFDDLSARGLTHRWIMSPRSSQAFALNLFAPLVEDGLRAVFTLLGHDAATVEPAEFEYSDAADRLGEARPASPHRTQVDVVLRGRNTSGERVVALIEVKFTETDFGGCSAYENPANPNLDCCRSVGIFGGDPASCFQLANHGEGRRRYDDYLRDVPVVAPRRSGDPGGCFSRGGINQPMRNLALAQVLLAHDEADKVAYALCAPADHKAIWRRFDEVRAVFPDTTQRTIRALCSADIVAAHPDGGRDFLHHYVSLTEAGPRMTPTSAGRASDDPCKRSSPAVDEVLRGYARRQSWKDQGSAEWGLGMQDLPLRHCDPVAARGAVDRLRAAHPRADAIAERLEDAIERRRVPEAVLVQHSRWCNSGGSWSAGVDPAREAAIAMYGFVPDRLVHGDGSHDQHEKSSLVECRRRLTD